MPGGIFWDAGDSPRAGQGGHWGTPRRLTKKEWRLGIYVYVGVVGPRQSLKVLMTFLPVFLPLAHRPLNIQSFFLLCLYNIVVLDSRFYGDCPGQVVFILPHGVNKPCFQFF